MSLPDGQTFAKKETLTRPNNGNNICLMQTQNLYYLKKPSRLHYTCHVLHKALAELWNLCHNGFFQPNYATTFVSDKCSCRELNSAHAKIKLLLAFSQAPLLDSALYNDLAGSQWRKVHWCSPASLRLIFMFLSVAVDYIYHPQIWSKITMRLWHEQHCLTPHLDGWWSRFEILKSLSAGQVWISRLDAATGVTWEQSSQTSKVQWFQIQSVPCKAQQECQQCD